ncbi:MAG: hypothetical protein V3T22_00335 [Planctomycetota bacterium]
MRQDQTGCRRIALEGGLGCLVVILSLLALILGGLRGGSPAPTHPGQTRESPSDPGTGALETLLEDALRESGVER